MFQWEILAYYKLRITIHVDVYVVHYLFVSLTHCYIIIAEICTKNYFMRTWEQLWRNIFYDNIIL